MSIQENINAWLKLDDLSKINNAKRDEINEQKNTLKSKIELQSEEQNLRKQNIQTPDGSIRFVELNQTKPLTWKSLELSLSQIIDNEMQVKQIITSVKNYHKQEGKAKFDITRKIN